MVKNVELIFFDVGNVLLHRTRNPLDDIAQTFNLTREQTDKAHKIATNNETFAKLWEGMCDLKSQRKMSLFSAKEFLKAANIPEDKQKIEKLINIWSYQKFDVLPGVYELLDYLKPKYRLAIISNAMPTRRIHEMVQHHLLDYFDPIIFSGELGIHKPDSRIFKHALELAQIEASKTAFIDDHNEYLDSAYKVGIKTLFQVRVIKEWDVCDKAILITDLLQLKKYL